MRTALALAALCIIATGCQFPTKYPGDAAESVCIKGRLSAYGAAILEDAGDIAWEKKPGYCSGESYTDKDGKRHKGQSHCTPEVYDRILAANCSQAVRVLKHGD